ncbi:SDR family NAD(P)-dependent oxidoreductase [Tomitella gaofuii]|uniref:SDR family NAD(P)-dependent oxidoreductase n=1 Tax=Tomitella gaofuii TaxID=2760083 RepID=UPI0015FCC3AD|nr:SDR family oxidoreductase [Tomitella gaofuii]
MAGGNSTGGNSTDIAVVTGAGSGIGRAIALRLAAGGARVVAADLDEAGAVATAEHHPDRITVMGVDIADRARVDALRDRVLAEVGVPTILINAAGWDRIAPFLEADAEFAQKVTAINYLGPVNMCSAFLPAMSEAGHGRVVNLASDAGRVGSAGETIYAGAKGGVIALTKSLAREMARAGITVNCVCPGPTDTPLFGSLPEKLQGALVKAIPFRRLAQPEEVAAAATFFVSPETSYITGQTLSVSGGLTMAG